MYSEEQNTEYLIKLHAIVWGNIRIKKTTIQQKIASLIFQNEYKLTTYVSVNLFCNLNFKNKKRHWNVMDVKGKFNFQNIK